MKNTTLFLAALLVAGSLVVTASSIRAEERAQDTKRESTAEVQEVTKADNDSRQKNEKNPEADEKPRYRFDREDD